MSELIDSSINLDDLKPRKRLRTLIDASAIISVDQDFPLQKYFKLSENLLVLGKQCQNKGSNELGLFYYLRYQVLAKKMRKYLCHTNESIGKMSVLDYKLKSVTNTVKELTKTVLHEYERAFNNSKLCVKMLEQRIDDEKRPTLSTIRTFVSGPETSITEDFKPPSKQKLSLLPALIVRDTIKGTEDTLHTVSRSRTDTITSLKKSIFPARQVTDFDLIHRQRRAVKGHRTVIIPSRVTTEFSYLSYRDMMQNKETVGYLTGIELNERELIVTHLILPEQFGFSDFFQVKHSNAMTKYLEQNHLLMLGWIHSHPLGSPYLSSSDMHYQSIFQSIFPEAVAMVYSAREMKSTIFNLTPDHGLDFILNCRRKGFHVHPTIPPIAMVSQHAAIHLIGDLTVQDFRNTQNVIEEHKGYYGNYSDRRIRTRSMDTNKGKIKIMVPNNKLNI